MWLVLWGWTGAAAAVAAWAVPRFLAAHQLTALNYRKQPIPLGSGLAVWITVAAHSMFLSVAVGDEWMFPSLPVAATVVFLAGWLDDTVGDVDVKGLRGHWQALRYEARLTTGTLKALAAAGAALWMSTLLAGALPSMRSMDVLGTAATTLIWLVRWCLAFLLMCLSANALNLLDLRPGRALKGFFVMGGVVLLGSVWQDALFEALVCLLPVLLSALCLFRQDIRAHSMLGDSGANLLGFITGFAVAAYTSWLVQIWVVTVLIVLHWAAERISLSEVIDRTGLLYWLDRLGRADRQS